MAENRFKSNGNINRFRNHTVKIFRLSIVFFGGFFSWNAEIPKPFLPGEGLSS